MEFVSPPPRADPSEIGYGTQDGRQEAAWIASSLARQLAAAVSEFDCLATLETGLGHGGPAMAIAGMHEQRGRGHHIAMDPFGGAESSTGLQNLRQAGLLHRVRLIAKPSEVALPELLGDDTEIDFALIEGPKRFEDAFLEFVYIDRMLATGGILALSGADMGALASVLDHVPRARSYELRSERGAELAVMRKIGQARGPETPVPTYWLNGTDLPAPESMPPSRNGARGIGVADAADPSHSSTTHSSSRELHLARMRATELRARVEQLGVRLVDAEQRCAELPGVRAEMDSLREELAAAKAAQEGAEYWLECMKSSLSWRITGPLRLAKGGARTLLGR